MKRVPQSELPECPNCHSKNTRPTGSRDDGKVELYQYTDRVSYVPYFECMDCIKNGRKPANFSPYVERKPKPEYNEFDRVIAYKIFNNLVPMEKLNKEVVMRHPLTRTKWTADHIAKLLGLEYKMVRKWLHLDKDYKPQYSDQELQDYIKTERKDISFFLLKLLGYVPNATLEIADIFLMTFRKTRYDVSPDNLDDYRYWERTKKAFRHILAEKITVSDFHCREDAIITLGAILRCQYSDLCTKTYNDFAYNKKTIRFQKRNRPLHRNAKDVALWLKDRAAPDNEYLCVDSKGQPISERKINFYLKKLCKLIGTPPIRFKHFCKDEPLPSNS